MPLAKFLVMAKQNIIFDSLPGVESASWMSNFDPTKQDWHNYLNTAGGSQDFSQLLQFMINSGAINPATPIEQLDLVKQLWDTQLSRILTSEQNKYNSPSAQLQRLMQTGMSRDAAFQLLSGGVQDSPAVAGQTPAPSEIAQRSQEISSNVAQVALSAAGSLFSMGLSAPSAVMQARVLANSAHLSRTQNEAYDLVGEAAGIADNAGVAINSDNFGNASKIFSTLEGLANKGDIAAKTFIQNKGNNLRSNYFVPRAAAMAHEARRSAADYDDYFDQNLALLGAEERVKNADENRLIQEYANLQQTFENIGASTEYLKQMKIVGEHQISVLDAQVKEIRAHAELLKQQGKTEVANRELIRARRLESQANAYKLRQEGYATYMDNLVQEDLTGLRPAPKNSNIHLVNASYLSTLLNQLKRMNKLNSRESIEAWYSSVMADVYATEQIGLMRGWLASGANEEFRNNPQLYSIAQALNESGLMNYYLSLTETNTDSHSIFNGAVQSDRTIRTNTVLDNFLNPSEPESGVDVPWGLRRKKK